MGKSSYGVYYELNGILKFDYLSFTMKDYWNWREYTTVAGKEGLQKHRNETYDALHFIFFSFYLFIASYIFSYII